MLMEDVGDATGEQQLILEVQANMRALQLKARPRAGAAERAGVGHSICETLNAMNL